MLCWRLLQCQQRCPLCWRLLQCQQRCPYYLLQRYYGECQIHGCS
uniref:Uncharacterized protein n=1 Tax=Arundo donax TaxID=35708 RepID=A0A0A9ASE5_ARUDO